MVWACVINENDENGNPKLTVVGTDKATCEASGTTDKRVHCLRPSNSHNCVTEELKGGNGVGLREYVGNKDTTQAGHKCAK